MISRASVFVFALALPALAYADTPPAPAPAPDNGPQIDAKADAALRRMSSFLSSQHSMRLQTSAVQEMVTTDGQKLQFVADQRVSIKRPDKARIERLDPNQDSVFRYDGKQLSVFGKRTGFYAVAPAPPRLTELIDTAGSRYGIDAPAGDLLVDDPYKELTHDVIVGRLIGVEPIDGIMCDHLAFVGREVDWQIWIERGSLPLPRRYTITSKLEPGAPEFSVSMTHWQPNAPIADTEFDFVPPPGAKPIEFKTMQSKR